MKAGGDPERFLLLDGLRGVAALVVLVYHRAYLLSDRDLMQHGYLAVDFFFLLSGFVIAQAYDDRMSSMGFLGFLRKRIIRLYPMVFAGALAGAAYMAARQMASPNPIFVPLAETPFALAANLVLIIPYFGPSGSLHPLNTPMWSLFYEVAANLIFGLFSRFLQGGALVGIILVSAALLAWRAAHADRLDVGWNEETFFWGFPRVCFSFFLGVALARFRRAGFFRAWRAPPWALVAILIATAVPPPGDRFPSALGGFYDLLCITAIFPAVLLLGANAPLGRGARLAQVAGDLSFPLYAFHMPVIALVTALFRQRHWDEAVGQPAVALVCYGVAIIVCWLVLKVYDEPVRAWLGRSPFAGPIRKSGRA